MFYAIVDAASLVNPTVLNNYKCKKVTVQFEPESDTSKYHFIFLLEINDGEINEVIENIQKEMIAGWYTFFWSEKMLEIVFNAKHFQIDLPNGWQSEAYKAAQEFGKSQGIPDVYLDFETHFKPYHEMVDKLA
jgi:hypothetical protein